MINEQKPSCKVLFILVRYSSKLNFLIRFSKNSQIPNFMEIRPLEARVALCGRTDMTKLILAFRNFANAPKNQ